MPEHLARLFEVNPPVHAFQQDRVGEVAEFGNRGDDADPVGRLQVRRELVDAARAGLDVGAAALERRHHPAARDVIGARRIVQTLGERNHVRGVEPDDADPQLGRIRMEAEQARQRDEHRSSLHRSAPGRRR